MQDSEKTNSAEKFRRINLWENLIILPAKGLLYGTIGGILATVGVVLVDGGWEPSLRKYVGFVGLAMLGFGMALAYGMKNYFMLKKLYGDKWKEE